MDHSCILYIYMFLFGHAAHTVLQTKKTESILLLCASHIQGQKNNDTTSYNSYLHTSVGLFQHLVKIKIQMSIALCYS